MLGARCCNSGEQSVVEVQAGSGSGHRAGLGGVDGLVPLAVLGDGPVRPFDVRRQRRRADPLEPFEIQCGFEADGPPALVEAVLEDELAAIVEHQPLAVSSSPRRP